MQSLIEQSAPQSQDQIIGQEQAVTQLVPFIDSYRTQKKKAMMLYGPSGVGKTSAVYALAQERDLEVVEVNASDVRNADAINTLFGAALGQQSLFAKGKIVLIDEIDGLAGNKDRGGVQAIAKLLATSTYPIILTATDPFITKLSSLRSKSVLVSFSLLDYKDIVSILKNVCHHQKIKYDFDAVVSLARRAGGDARAAINNLHMLTGRKKTLEKQDIEVLEDRDKKESIMNALNKIFKTTQLDIALHAFDTIKEDVNDQFLWIDENVSKEYAKSQDLWRAYNAISKADVFNRRIRRWQHWRFLVYVGALLSGGVAIAKDEKYPGLTKYSQSGRILKMWWAKQKSMKKKAIAERIAAYNHQPTIKVLQHTLAHFMISFSKNTDFREQAIVQLELDPDHVAWLEKHAPA